MTRILIAAALLAISGQAHAAGRSIVGDWGTSPADCGTQYAYRIGPKSVVTDTASCSFEHVSRRGETVTFTGACDYGSEAGPETIVATRAGNRLAMRYLKAGDTVNLTWCGRPGPLR